MELKWKSGLNANALGKLSTGALEQIKIQRYNHEMLEVEIDKIIKLGVAFSGKNVIIKTKQK